MKRARKQILAAAVAGTVVSVLWTAWRDDQGPVVDAAVRVRAMPARLTVSNGRIAAHVEAVAERGRDPWVEPRHDPFKVESFLPPSLPTAAPAPAPAPPAPTAPPFPYRYFGRMTGTDGKPVIYLSRGDDLVPIHEHEILDNTYRVDSIGEASISVTYLPLDIRTELPVQSAAQ